MMRMLLASLALGALHCVPGATSGLETRPSEPVLYLEAVRLEPGDAGVDGGAKAFDPSALEAADALGFVPDAGWAALGPGCWLPVSSCVAKAKGVADLQAENERLRGGPHDFSFGDLQKAAWLGFALGAATAIVTVGLVCREATGSVLCQR